jgi:eukaryotic-like serine/threonine-protein kinase
LGAVVEASGPLPSARVIHLLRQACGSLAEAHDAGLVHRDIKPANLFVAHIADDYDFLKVLDFGVAGMLESKGKTALTETGILLGTPAFLPPELCAGEKADVRSDVYSLGAVMYFMLTGAHVFQSRTLSGMLNAHIYDTPVAPSVKIGKQVAADLEAIVLRCLAKRPQDRYDSTRALEAALAECEDAGRWSYEDARCAWLDTRKSFVVEKAADIAS